MKIFSWLRNRRNRSEDINKPNQEPMHYHHHIKNQSCKEEFWDWPNGLLAIGTFGTNNLKQSEKLLMTNEDDMEAEEQFEEELMKVLLNNHMVSVDQKSLSVEELLHCLVQHENGSERKDIRADNQKRGGIGKKSLSFLIKKAFLCKGGFVPTPPMLRDPLSDLKLDHSRMEKILRAMLHKKIYPQRPTPKKCLDMAEIDEYEEEHEEGNHESKWVKTDSEYIVLEI